jgi:hypothetical protein
LRISARRSGMHLLLRPRGWRRDEAENGKRLPHRASVSVHLVRQSATYSGDCFSGAFLVLSRSWLIVRRLHSLDLPRQHRRYRYQLAAKQYINYIKVRNLFHRCLTEKTTTWQFSVRMTATVCKLRKLKYRQWLLQTKLRRNE